jgi:hypothetical protein
MFSWAEGLDGLEQWVVEWMIKKSTSRQTYPSADRTRVRSAARDDVIGA